MPNIKITQFDAFTDKMFGGNPGAVVHDASELSDDEMRQIAREMNLSETGFILPSDKGDFRLRYFTPPGNEIKFCGHVTIGSLCTVAAYQMFGIQQPKTYSFQVQTNAGTLTMDVHYQNQQNINIEFESPKIDFISDHFTHQQVAEGLGIDPDILDTTKPVMREQTNNYMYLTAKSLKYLEQANIDYQKSIQFTTPEKIVIVCLMTNETFDSNNHIHTRGFAPYVGIPEDPVTGSMQGGLAAYAHMNGLIPNEQRILQVEQGHFVNRPGGLKAELTIDDKKYQAKITGTSVEVFTTEIKLP